MIYENILHGIFISRPNRFIANVEMEGESETAHVKNTGRCKELLVPGAKIILQKSNKTGRKTNCTLIAVYKGARLINMDSQAPNKVFGEYLQCGRYINDITLIRPETKYKGSRFDFYAETEKRKIFIEVKGVTLEENGAALFPDAPTERGVKHLNELAQCVGDGYEAHVVFVIQMSNVRYFTPNKKTHPAFGETLILAAKAGVKVTAFNCLVTENSLNIGEHVPVKLYM